MPVELVEKLPAVRDSMLYEGGVGVDVLDVLFEAVTGPTGVVVFETVNVVRLTDVTVMMTGDVG